MPVNKLNVAIAGSDYSACIPKSKAKLWVNLILTLRTITAEQAAFVLHIIEKAFESAR